MSQQSGEAVPSANPFPENELPRFLLNKLRQYARRSLIALRPPPYKPLASFSHAMALCAASSADLVRGLELCLKPLSTTAIGKAWSGAPEELRKGTSLADALAPAEPWLPPFFLPVIRAGEASGRLDEAFHFLEQHCSLLAGPAAAIRNVWFFPVAILISGVLIRVVLFLIMGYPGEAFFLLVQESAGLLRLAFFLAVAMFSPVRYLIDKLRLSLPLIGPLEREIALHRFFRVLSLVYAVAGDRVETMIRTSAQTVSNRAARIDLSKAATAIEEKATISDAFRRVDILSDDEKVSIEVGEMSGVLESTFARISEDTGASMVAKLAILERVLVKIAMGLVMLSLIATAFQLAMMGFGQ